MVFVWVFCAQNIWMGWSLLYFGTLPLDTWPLTRVWSLVAWICGTGHLVVLSCRVECAARWCVILVRLVSQPYACALLAWMMAAWHMHLFVARSLAVSNDQWIYNTSMHGGSQYSMFSNVHNVGLMGYSRICVLVAFGEILYPSICDMLPGW